MRRSLMVVGLALWCLHACGLAFSGDFVAVIASPKFPADGVTASELRDLYLGRSDALSGRKVAVFHLSPQNAARALFERVVVGKEGTELRSHWIDLKLTRPGVVEPRSFRNPEGLVELVATSDDAVAYVPLSSAAGRPVKVLRLDGRSPEAGAAGGYPLALPDK